MRMRAHGNSTCKTRQSVFAYEMLYDKIDLKHDILQVGWTNSNQFYCFGSFTHLGVHKGFCDAEFSFLLKFFI